MRSRRFINVTTLGDLIDRAGTEHTRDALVFPDARLTYPELAQRSTDYARSLYALGVRAGDKVGILMHNQVEYVVAMVAAAKLAAVGVPINGRFKAHELGFVIPHADIAVLVTARGPAEAVDFPGLIAEIIPALPADAALRHVVDLSDSRGEFIGHAEFAALAETVDAATIAELQIRVRLRDPALLMYTSGTTAQPKGCLLCHEAIVRQGSSVAETRFELTETDRLWDPLPLFHCGGIVPMIGALSCGATFYHAGHFDPDQSLRTLAEEQITVAFPAFETIWFGILNHPQRGDVDLSSLRLIMSIATPERLAQFEREMPWAKQVSSYGSTESSTNLTLSYADDPYEARIGTLGTPIEGLEIRIVDPETGVERPTDEVGELCFRGYSLFSGYYKNPEATAAAIDADGWFHTGDLGAVDAAGRLIYTGRLKDMLKVGGENVSALEIEDYLARHPAINIVQVVGAPDPKYDEVPAAFVQLAPGTQVTEQEVIEFCTGMIASFKVPRYVRVVSEWPMSGTKIQKFVLRDRIAAELAESRQAVT